MENTTVFNYYVDESKQFSFYRMADVNAQVAEREEPQHPTLTKPTTTSEILFTMNLYRKFKIILPAIVIFDYSLQ